jgi:uncharacterized BrkB/YihY/UPF0761 family membrane protein
VSFLLTFWTVVTGSKSIPRGVDIAYTVPRRRQFWRLRVVGTGMMLLCVWCGVLGLTVHLGLPAVITALGF